MKRFSVIFYSFRLYLKDVQNIDTIEKNEETKKVYERVFG